MENRKKYNWQAIIEDIKINPCEIHICEKYKIINRRYLIEQMNNFREMGFDVPQLKIRKKTHINPTFDTVKITRFKEPKADCPIMQKINVISLLNKKKSQSEISQILKIDISEVSKIIQNSKKRGNNV